MTTRSEHEQPTEPEGRSPRDRAWYAEIGHYLRLPGSPRVLTISSLCKLIDGYRPDIAPLKIPTALHELYYSDLLKPVTTEILFNMAASPPVAYAEVAHWLTPHSVVSLASAMYREDLTIGVPPVTVQCVIPILGKRERDIEVTVANGVRFEFYTLPERFFPPLLEDYGDCYDRTKSYPCFTREKALLDLLYITCLKGFRGLFVPAADSSFNRPALFSLAHRMSIVELLHTHLASIPLIKKHATLTPATDPSATRTAEYRRKMLNSIAEIWIENPSLSFSEVLIAVKPDDSSLDLYEVSDDEWHTGIAEYRAIT